MKVNRREFLAATSALLFSHTASGAASTPSRPARKDCFFGLHFDLHPNAQDKELGRDLTDAMVNDLLVTVRPDFIQYDSKGHPGYLGFPSKTGMAAPGIVADSLAVWRRVTAAHGVALYNHFSGVLDGLAVEKHPDWARVGADGKRDGQETSLFGPYERELMIPELLEVARNYDLDGSWVDGDSWAVQPDYCEGSRQKFEEKTGIALLPQGPGDKGWNEFLELQREQFRKYVAAYVDALHTARPGYQITSNWMYSTFAPERPTVALDYLSGDIADIAALRMARIQARYLSRCGKPWDLMSWGFERGENFGGVSDKLAVELAQEAAVVLAQGGAYQIYYVPSRAGWIDAHEIETAAEVAKFCRQRQRWSHGSESVPEVGVLFSGRTLYRTASRVFGGWGSSEAPAAGAMSMLLACGYSVDLIPDWQLAECVAQYPLMVLPDWKDVGDEVANTLVEYVKGGGKLLVCGAENAQLFSGVFGIKLKSAAQEHSYLVADESGLAELHGSWVELDAAHEDVVAQAYRSRDIRKDSLPLGVRVQHGKGTAIVCATGLTSAYDKASTPIFKSIVRGMVSSLHAPLVTLEGDYPAVEIVLRKKDGHTLIHFINTEGAPVTSEFRHTGVVPPTGPIRFKFRLPGPPAKIVHGPDVVLEPEDTVLPRHFEAGEWHGVLPELHIHAIVRIATGS
ncbi:MAG: hypothetical protein ABSG96_22200 [Terracidiphilus sp.]